MLVPPKRSIATPARSSSSTTPMCAKQRAPPPDSTIPIERPARRRASRSTMAAWSPSVRATWIERGSSACTQACRLARDAPPSTSTRSQPRSVGSGAPADAPPPAIATVRSPVRIAKRVQARLSAGSPPTTSTRSWSCSLLLSSVPKAVSEPASSESPSSSTSTEPNARSASARRRANAAASTPGPSGSSDATRGSGSMSMAVARASWSVRPRCRVMARAKSGLSESSRSNASRVTLSR